MTTREVNEPDYRAIFEGLPGLYMLLDPNLHIVAATDAYLEATLTRRDEIVGRYVFDVFPDNPNDPSADSGQNSRASFERVARDRVTDVMVLQRHDVRGPDGTFHVRYWSPVNSPFLDSDGNLEYIVHRVENVTDFVLAKQEGDERAKITDALREQSVRMEADLYARSHEVAEADRKLKLANEEMRRLRELEKRESEAAAERNRAFLRAVVDSVSSLVTVKDADGCILLANEAAARFHAMSVAQMEGMRDTELPGFTPEFIEQDRAVIRTREEVLAEVEMVGSDGVKHWFIAVKTPMLEADGSCRRMLETAADITWRKRAEHALQDMNARLSEADARKDEFIAILSHELRNPLAPIRYALPILQEERLSTAAHRAVDVVHRQVDHLTRLVDDLLDVSRITRGKIELRKEQVTLESVVAAAVEAASPAIGAARHSLDIKVADEPIWICADAARMSQIVTNLLNNSAKYTPRGGRISLEAGREDGHAVVRVCDNGIGIPTDELGSIFDMFRQVSKADKSQGGLGIGLGLVKRLVEMHGGTIEALSEGIGRGAEFIVRLPISENEKPNDANREITIGEASPGGRRLKVLVVDDNVDLVEMLSFVVESAGHDVRKALDGRSAVSAALAYKPDVVLLDLGLPVMTGLQVARELRRHPDTAKAHLVALTGWGQAEDRRETEEAGFDHHLTKPTEPETVKNLLASFASGS